MPELLLRARNISSKRVRGGPQRALYSGTFAVMGLLEVSAGPYRVVSFDGRVLEVFGGSVRRFHVRLLSVAVSSPDRHGNRNVTLRQAGTESALPVDEPT